MRAECKFTLRTVLFATAAALAALAALAQRALCAEVVAPSSDFYAVYQGDGQIHPWHVQRNVWMMAGEPGMTNVAVQIGDEGLLVVDTGVQPMATKLLNQIEQLAEEQAGDQKAIRYVIDTDGALDHIGGNQVIREGGAMILAGNFVRQNPNLMPGASVISNDNVLTRLIGQRADGHANAIPEALWPTDTEDFDVYSIHFDGEAVQLFHPHLAVTDGSLMVMFRLSDVIATGDIVDMTSYPPIDTVRGGTIDGELVALNHIIEMAVPEDKQQGGTIIIPGHGRLADQSDVVHYKNIITIIRNRIQFYKNQGKSLQQVIALKPTWDYDVRWGHDVGPWTTREFIEAVYETLPARGPSFSLLDETLVPGAGGRAY